MRLHLACRFGLLLALALPAAQAQPAATPDTAQVRQLRRQAMPPASPEQGLGLLKQALALARRARAAPAERAVLNDLAETYGRAGDYVEAQRYANEAQQLAAPAHDTLELGRAYLSAAKIATSDAARMVRMAQLAAGEFGRSPRYAEWQARALSELAAGYLRLRQVAAAKRAFRQARQVSQQVGTPGLDFRLLINFAPALAAFEPDSAGQLLGQARRLADERLRTPYPRAFVRQQLASLAQRQGRWAAVVQLNREAAALARQAGIPITQANALRELAEGLRHQGLGAAAYDTLRRAQELHDSLTAQDQRGELARLQVRFDVARQQARIRELEQQRQLAGLQAERQRLRSYGLLGGLLALAGFSLVLLGQRRRLHRSQAQLQAANATKDQLIRIVGHDLRSPMASLQQLTPLLHEVIEQPERGPAHSLIRTLDAGAQHLGNMVDNLFQWARAQGGQLVNNPERLRVSFVVGSIAALYAPTAQLKGIDLQTATPPELAVQADLGLLTTVLRNLTSNALKFSPRGGTVQLTVRVVAGGQVELAVSDSGPGLAPARLRELLTADRLPSTPGTSGEPGTGLGLPLSARFVRLMGGELHVAARPEGGTRCWFRLPAA